MVSFRYAVLRLVVGLRSCSRDNKFLAINW